jgi:ATP phosphoribosyltransferase
VDKQNRLKIAVQKSGRLTEASFDLLSRVGLKYTRAKDQLYCYGENLPLDVLLVRDDDIPDLVREDVCDLGIVGENVLSEHADANADGPNAIIPLRPLDYGRCRLSLAVPESFVFESPSHLNGLRIATTYPKTLGRWLQANGVNAEIVPLSGSVEIAPRLGRAEVICDLVSTGSTLAANRLKEVATIKTSQAMLIQTPKPLSEFKAQWVARLLQRIDGVIRVKESKYIMLHAPTCRLAEIKTLLPGSESPTVLPLDGQPDRVAVHALCHENVFWETLERLKAAGASALLVLPVEKMLP